MDLGNDGNDRDGMVEGFWTGWLKIFRMGFLRTKSPKNHVPYPLQTNLMLCQDIIATCLKILSRPPQGQKQKKKDRVLQG